MNDEAPTKVIRLDPPPLDNELPRPRIRHGTGIYHCDESTLMTRDVDVFFYGLFMDADALRARGMHPTNIRAARVSDFALRIGKRATLVPGVGTEAHGFVMALCPAEIEALYSDSSVRAYHPEAVLAELADGQKCPALCFNLETPPDPQERNAEYADKLRELARRLKLPTRYVESIR